MLINTQNTHYTTGGMIINAQDTNYYIGEMVVNTQATNYAIHFFFDPFCIYRIKTKCK